MTIKDPTEKRLGAQRRTGNASMCRTEDVAVIGMACRFPMAADTRQFWHNLLQGVNSVRQIPDDRWKSEAFFDLDIQTPNKSLSRWCGFIDGIQQFDARFFNISYREAACMDPQQRLLLETTYHCIEDAGLRPDMLQEKLTAVFVGTMGQDYQQIAVSPEVPTDGYACLGCYDCMLANRISHVFGLSGPSYAIAAACASSLVALHEAKQSLRTGGASFAIAAGVSVNCHPWKYISFSKSRMLSPDGRCKTFDAKANGYVPGDGIGVVLLQRLEDAIADRHFIYGVVKGSAINHTGAAPSITAPRTEAQRDVILAAYEDADLTPDTTTYVEAHGTGTSLGDPIEIEALTQAFRRHTKDSGYCRIGSVKTNIGHLEAAAGIAGVIKVMLMMQRTKIVPSLNLEIPNPIIPFKSSPFKPATRVSDWNSRTSGQPLRAGVSSFGFGGSNSHVVLESWPIFGQAENQQSAPLKESQNQSQMHFFILSAKTRKGLDRLIKAWRTFVKNKRYAGSRLENICGTLTAGRNSYNFRYGLLIRSKPDLEEKLEAAVTPDQPYADVPWQVHIGQTNWENAKNASKVILNRFGPVVKQVTTKLEDDPVAHLGVDLWKHLENYQAKSLGAAEENKETVLRLNGAVFGLLLSMGLRPELICGAGAGFWSSLLFSGMLSPSGIRDIQGKHKEAVKIRFRRPLVPFQDPVSGQVLQPFRFDKAYLQNLIEMADIGSDQMRQLLNQAELLEKFQYTFKKYMEEWRGIEKYTQSPLDAFLLDKQSLLATGETARRKRLLAGTLIFCAIRKLHRKWNLKGGLQVNDRRARELIDLLVDGVMPVEILGSLLLGYDPQWDDACQLLNGQQKSLDRRNPYLFLKKMNKDVSEIPNPAAWIQAAVKAAPAGLSSSRAGQIVFGPAPRELVGEQTIVINPAGDPKTILHSALLQMWARGMPIHLERLYPGGSFKRVPLPLYPFERKAFWLHGLEGDGSTGKPDGPIEATATKNVENHPPPAESPHVPSDGFITKTFYHHEPLIAAHRICDEHIMPAAGMIALARQALLATSPEVFGTFSRLVIENPAIINPKAPLTLEVTGSGAAFKVYTQDTRFCRGVFKPESFKECNHGDGFPRTDPNTELLPIPYRQMRQMGYQYGEALQVIRSIQHQTGVWRFKLEAGLLDPDFPADFNPALLDGIFQSILAFVLIRKIPLPSGILFVPYLIETMHLKRPLAQACYVELTLQDVGLENGDLSAGARAYDLNGTEVLHIEKMRFKGVSTRFLEHYQGRSPSVNGLLYYKPVWQRQSKATIDPPESDRLAVLFHPGTSLGDELARRLTDSYRTCCTVWPAEAFKTRNRTTFAVNPFSEQDHVDLLQALPQPDAQMQLDVYYLWELGTQGDSLKTDAPTLTQNNLRRLFCFFKALVRESRQYASIRGVIPVCNSHGVIAGDLISGYAHAGLDGFIRTVMHEYPKLTLKVIDFDSAGHASRKSASILIQEGCSSEPRALVAYRKAHRYVLQLEPFQPVEHRRRVSLAKGGAYLIIGGLGGIGRRIASWITDTLPVRLVLAGRSTISREGQQYIARLQAKDSKVIYVQADVAEKDQTAKVVREIRRRYGPLKGVIHAGGVLEDRFLASKDWNSFQRVIASKISGSQHLNFYTRKEPLDFFVVFSSVVALTGNIGQTDYAAANSFLDAFIHFRESNGFPGRSISVNWPVWADGGMGRNQMVLKQLARQGILPISDDEGLDAFQRILAQSYAQVLVLKAPDDRFWRQVKRLDRIIEVNRSPAKAPGAHSEAAPARRREATAAMSTADRLAVIEEQVTVAVSHTLSVPLGEIDRETDFKEYGLDSLGIADLVEQMAEIYGDFFHHAAILENASVCRLAHYIFNHTKLPGTDVRQPSSAGSGNRPEQPSLPSGSETENIAAFLTSVLGEVLSVPVDEIDPTTDIADYGVDSFAIADIVDRLSEHYGDYFHHAAILKHPTVSELAAYIQHLIPAADQKASCRIAAVQSPRPWSAPEKDLLSQSNSASAPRAGVNKQAIAIIGMAGRFPGAGSLEDFWGKLQNGRCLVSEVPSERFDLTPYYSTKIGEPGKTYSRWAALLDDVAGFDAAFFNIQDHAAIEIDPQQRIFLEITQMLWDNAGYTYQEVAGSNTGIFLGCHESGYSLLQTRSPKYRGPNGIVNTISNLIGGRVMQHYDLRGPMQTTYSACSSSLVALHAACHYLSSGEVEMAIAGGIELLLNADWHIGFSQMKVLSPEGRCKVFDRQANGFVLGEGAGVVLLKTLSRAIQDGDQILAVIRGSAVNNDGNTMGLTTPNFEAQKEVIRKAIETAGVDAASITVYEAHGTGTPLGDPIEVKAATEVFREYTPDVGYCAIGSVKSNIGHLLSAAGIASLIKVLLGLHHRQIPPTLNCMDAHPRFDFEHSPFYPNLQLRPWEDMNGPLRAGVSSFGFGGTNCHVIVEDFDPSTTGHKIRRQPLSGTDFKRKRYWLGEPVQSETEAFLRPIFKQLESGLLTLEDARQQVRSRGFDLEEAI